MNINIPVPDGLNDEIRRMFRSIALEAIEEVKGQEAMLKPWMTQREACKALGIAYNTLQGFRQKGLKVTVIEGKTLISRDTLIQFMKDHEV